MLSNISDDIKYAIELHELGYLPGPDKCTCGSTNFVIYKDISFTTTSCSFRCINSNCRLKYPIRTNSFFNKFSHKSLKEVSEIIKCFLIREFNAKQTRNFLKNEFNITTNITSIYAIYKAIRETIYQYLDKMYQTDKISTKDEHEYFSVDESLIRMVDNYGC